MQEKTNDPNVKKRANTKSQSKTEVKKTNNSAKNKKQSTKSIDVKKTTKNKSTTKKVTRSTPQKKSTTKVVSKSNSTKKTTAKNVSKKKHIKKADVIEYYDLPYRYNQTVVKILAQTPNTLFVYWDISEEDKKRYIKDFGDNFFENTVPVLIVHNKTMNYSFEIEINDFANSWYFNVKDAKCDYELELGRKSKQNKISLPNDYMHITSSNNIEAPNNHILFEKKQKVVFFRNIKTNNLVSKDVSKLHFMNYIGKIYNIYDIYKEIYKHEELENLENLSSSSF